MKYLIGFFIAFGLSMNCQAVQNGDSDGTQPVDSKDIESFEVRDSSNQEPSSQKCIGLTEAQVIIRQYMSSLVGANFNEDFPWLLEKRQITAEHVSWVFSGLCWSRNQSKYLTGALVSQDIVDLGPAEWGEYSVDCQGVIRAEYFSE